MKVFLKISPVFFTISACAQEVSELSLPVVEYGYCTSTFGGVDIGNFITPIVADNLFQNKRVPDIKALPSSSYGWKEGMFLWFNLNSNLSVKTELNFGLNVNNYKSGFNNTNKETYSVSYLCDFKPQFIIKLGKVNHHPIIKMAKCMSYYLSGTQTYLIMGPKITYQSTDKLFLNGKGATYFTVGTVIGFGFDHLFPNLDFAPEIYMSLEYQPPTDDFNPLATNRFFTSLTLALNIF